MNLSSTSFREKSAWITLGVLLVVFVPYFTFIFRLFAAEHLLAGAVLGAFVAATIFMILLARFFGSPRNVARNPPHTVGAAPTGASKSHNKTPRPARLECIVY